MEIRKLTILLLLAAAGALGSTARATEPAIPAGIDYNATDVTLNSALLRLPAADQATFNEAMATLAGTGANGTFRLATMLQPASRGNNATVEYALSGLAAYVSAPGREGLRQGVREGLKQGVEAVADAPNRATLLALFQRCGESADAPFLAKYVSDPALGQFAVNALVSIEGTDPTLLSLIKEHKTPNAMLANAAGEKNLTAAEPILLKWLSDKNATAADSVAIFTALSKCGDTKALTALGNIARKNNYTGNATAAYMKLLSRMAGGKQNSKVLAAAHKLLSDSEAGPNIKAAATNIIFASEGKKAMPLLLGALDGEDRSLRVNALRAAEPWADEDVYAALGSIISRSGKPETKVDIINWLGTSHAASQIEPIVTNFDSADPETSAAAIKAAAKIGGDKALNALVNRLNRPGANGAVEALLHFNGDVEPGIMRALADNEQAQSAALRIASRRHITAAAPKTFELLTSADPALRAAAYQALPGVVSASDFSTLSSATEALVDTENQESQQITNALLASVERLSPAEIFAKAGPAAETSAHPERYYPLLAKSATSQAIAILKEAYDSTNPLRKNAALDALLTVDSPEMFDVMNSIAATSGEPSAVRRLATLADKSALDSQRKSEILSQAMGYTSDAASRNALLRELANTPTATAFKAIAISLNDNATAKTAAEALRAILAKSLGVGSPAELRAALNKAAEIYRAGGTADDGYALDDITGIIARLPQ